MIYYGFVGSIAEREHQKWKNATSIPNNPYSAEALQKRLSNSSLYKGDFVRNLTAQLENNNNNNNGDTEINHNEGNEKSSQMLLGGEKTDYNR